MKINTNITIGLCAGIFGSVVVSVLAILMILRSTSSTAGLGFIFALPQYFIASYAIFFFWGYHVGNLTKGFKSSDAKDAAKKKFSLVITVIFSLAILGVLGKGLLLASTVSQIGNMYTSTQLTDVLETSLLKNNKFVVGAVVQNTSASPELLDTIAKIDHPTWHEPMWHPVWSLFPVSKNNGKDRSVASLLAANTNTSADTLSYLANNYLITTIIDNPNTPIEVFRLYEAKRNYVIDWELAQSPRTPRDVFEKLLDIDRKNGFPIDDDTRFRLITRNPGAPADIKAKATEIFKREFPTRQLEY